MMEIFSNMLSKEDGEFYCMGTFTPGWVSHLGELRIPDQDLRGVKKFLRHAVFRARCLMMEYARIREVAKGDARPLRQTSIMHYVVEEVPAEEKIKGKKAVAAMETGSCPPIDIWSPSAGGWGRDIRKGGDVCAPPCVPLPQVGLRQQHLEECGFGALAPHTLLIKGTVSAPVLKASVVDSRTIVDGGTLDGTATGSADATWEELVQGPVSFFFFLKSSKLNYNLDTRRPQALCVP